jgi:hypothetical protein
MKPRGRAAANYTPPTFDPKSVFINIPYDDDFEPLYLAFIAGICGFGLTPRATLEIPGSQRRLNRIFRLIRACRYSFHDISRVELDRRRPPTPRFNMPFELGLAVAWARAFDRPHDWVVFEARPYRQQKSLSDLNGTEVYIHGARPIGLFRALTNVLEKSRHRPTVQQLQGIYRDIKAGAVKIKRNLATRSLCETRPFKELVAFAQLSARRRVASLR